MTVTPDPIAYPPRGLSHDEAARYVGVGPTKFDELVEAGVMPRPRRFGRRVVWDRVQLDQAFSAQPQDGQADTIDALLERTRERN